MKMTNIVSSLLLLTVVSSAKADCLRLYDTAEQEARTNADKYLGLSMAGLMGGTMAATVGGTPILGGIVFTSGLILLVDEKVKQHNVQKELGRAKEIVTESKQGDGLALRELESEAMRSGKNLTVSQIAQKINEANAADQLCPRNRSVLGYSAIKKILLN